MPEIPIIKPKVFLKYLKHFNCKIIDITGSHHKIINTKNNRVSILAVHNKDLKRGAFAGILKQLDINIDEFVDFIKNN